LIIEEECPRILRRGWAAMIRKVYEVDSLLCPKCGATMKVIALLTDYPVVDRIINHLRLTSVASKRLPAPIVYQEVLMAAEAGNGPSGSTPTFWLSTLGLRRNGNEVAAHD